MNYFLKFVCSETFKNINIYTLPSPKLKFGVNWCIGIQGKLTSIFAIHFSRSHQWPSLVHWLYHIQKLLHSRYYSSKNTTVRSRMNFESFFEYPLPHIVDHIFQCCFIADWHMLLMCKSGIWASQAKPSQWRKKKGRAEFLRVILQTQIKVCVT